MKNQTVIFNTFSNLNKVAYGDSVNDLKLIKALESNYSVIKLFPFRNKSNKITLKEIFLYFIKFLRLLLKRENIFISRGAKLSLPVLLGKRILKNKIILRLGCTPFMFIEKASMLRSIVENGIKYKVYNYIERLLEIYAARKADLILVENQKARGIVSKFGVPHDKIQINPYYVEGYFMQSKSPNPEYEENNKFNLGYTGRFQKYDLLIAIIMATKKGVQDGYNVHLNLIGDGPKRSEIESIVMNLTLQNNVHFIGALPHKDVAKKMENFHCLVIPMLKNICPSTISIKILEGVMMGKIIITSNSGNNSSLFGNNKDLILNYVNASEIYQKIILVLKNYSKYKLIAETIKFSQQKTRSKMKYQRNLINAIKTLL